MSEPSVKYGKIFERFGNIYVEFDGGAILLSHALDRAIELGHTAVADRIVGDAIAAGYFEK